MTQEIAQQASQNKAALQKFRQESRQTAQDLVDMRAAFLFTAFSMMAKAEIVRMLTERFQQMQQSMTDAYREIEYQAVTASTVMTSTGEKTEEVMERMIELGVETEYTAVEAGEAIEVLARAGFDVEESLAAAGPVLDMARANNMQVAETARFAAGMYRGWNLETQDMNDIMEENIEYIDEAEAVNQQLAGSMAVITHASRQARMRAEEMAQAMRFATAAAETVGWSMEQVAAGMMAAADRMIEAGMAGRSFRRVMTRIGMVAGETGRGIQQARDLMDEYGIQLQDAEGDMLSFIEIVEQLEDATEDLTGTQEVNLYQQLAGMRGMNALAAAVDEGSDALRENERRLKMSSAAAGLAESGIEDVRGQMKEWVEELEEMGKPLDEMTLDIDHFREEAEVTRETAIKLSEAFFHTGASVEDLKEDLEELTIVSEMVNARLDTLEGTMILLESSIEAMWAELAEGLYAEIMQAWVDVLRNLTDAIGALPDEIKTLMAITITYLSILGRYVPQLMMIYGLLLVNKAAMAAQEVEMVKMAERRSEAIAQMINESNVRNELVRQRLEDKAVRSGVIKEKERDIYTTQQLIAEIGKEQKTINFKNLAKKEEIAMSKKSTLQKQIEYLQQQKNVDMDRNEIIYKAKKTLVEDQYRESMSRSKAQMLMSLDAQKALNYYINREGELKAFNTWQTKMNTKANQENTIAQLGNMRVTESMTDRIKEKSLTQGILNNKMKMGIALSYSMFAAMMLLSYGYMRGNDTARALGLGIVGVASALYLLNKHQKVASVWNTIQAKTTALLTASKWGLFSAIMGVLTLIGVGIAIYYLWRESTYAAVAAVGALIVAMYILNKKLLVFNKLTGGILILVSLLVVALHYLLDYIFDIDEAMIENSLIPTFLKFGKVLEFVGKSIRFIIDLFRSLIDAIRSADDILGKFGDFVMGIIGNSLIPEAFENGIARVINQFDLLDERILAEEERLMEFYGVINELIGNSLIPEAFERGTERIRNAMTGLQYDLGLQQGFGRVENRWFYEQPYIMVDLSDFTSKKEVDPEEITKYVQEGVEEGFKKYSRQLGRG